MAELAGLSIAANVAQFVVLGLQSAQYIYKAYNLTDDFIRERAELDTVSRSIGGSIDIVKALPEVKHNRELTDIINLSKTLALELEAKLARLKACGAKGGRRARMELAMRSLWAKSDIKHLHDRLIRLRDQVSYHLVLLSRYASQHPSSFGH